MVPLQDMQGARIATRAEFGRGHFQGIGWKIRLQQKRTNYFLTLAKEVVIGNALKRGDDIYYYLVDCEGRKAIIVFLDGKERPNIDSIRLGRITFLIRP